jgi:hypothetical protein
MAETKPLEQVHTTPGEAAVDGLLAGVGAGAAMAAYLLGIGWLVGEAPADMLGRFDPSAGGSALVGLLAHLATAGVYGGLFGLGWRILRRFWPRLPGALVGLVYGLLLYGLAQGVLLPWANSALLAIPPVHFAIAHLIYGLALGLVGRRTNKA